MELNYAGLSSPGPVRERNEAAIGFRQLPGAEESRDFSAVAVLAEGTGGGSFAETASRLAVETVLSTLSGAGEGSTPRQLLARMFDAAGRAVRELPAERRLGAAVPLELCLALFYGDLILVEKAGRGRVFLVREGEWRALEGGFATSGGKPWSWVSGEEEAGSRDVALTGGPGSEPPFPVDREQAEALPGDLVVLCSPGLSALIPDPELTRLVSGLPPAQACRQLVSLAESRGAGGPLSIQVVRFGEVGAQPSLIGAPRAHETPPPNGGYDLQPGRTLDERFLITEIISRSGMATVFKALDRATGQEVALKVPFLQFECDPGFYSRFLREEEIGRRLDHPYLLKFFAVERRSRPYLVTEFLRGHTLAEMLKEMRPLPEADALRLAGRICEALAHMHGHRVIHRDLKPQNVMICPDGSIRILDFGIARSTGRRFTFAGFTPAMGTPEYMAPEQVSGRRGDERTDIYTLGVMLYEMVTGEIPFAAADGDVFAAMDARVTGDPPAPRRVRRGLSEQVEEIILHAMEREPRKRYQSVAALKEELDDPARVQLTGRSLRLRTPSAWRRRLRRGVMIGAALAAVSMGLAQLILLILRRGP